MHIPCVEIHLYRLAPFSRIVLDVLPHVLFTSFPQLECDECVRTVYSRENDMLCRKGQNRYSETMSADGPSRCCATQSSRCSLSRPVVRSRKLVSQLLPLRLQSDLLRTTSQATSYISWICGGNSEIAGRATCVAKGDSEAHTLASIIFKDVLAYISARSVMFFPRYLTAEA